jgi:hypothetical protein
MQLPYVTTCPPIINWIISIRGYQSLRTLDSRSSAINLGKIDTTKKKNLGKIDSYYIDYENSKSWLINFPCHFTKNLSLTLSRKHSPEVTCATSC